MRRLEYFRIVFAIIALCAFAMNSAPAADQPVAARDLNTPRTFPEISTRAEWKQRARDIREQVLVSCGLWPLPERAPLREQVFGKIERDGYSVEKVYFQTYPGFYLAGNLYRPLGRGRGPFPGILNPHGHWEEGRLTDTADGSVVARCISFARQGMVAFAYDMVGYNDTQFPDTPPTLKFGVSHRLFGTNQTDLLWNISLMGLQTWNSVRALDFLASLPDVDRKRLACTGASGGGTQTFMLGAIEDRLAAQAPIVMVSHTMQGGCLCENAPGLRVEYSNMEIAAAAAPRRQLLVAATGDWTKTTMEVEGPAIAGIYRLLGAADNFHYTRFDFGHNYNETTREAVYTWFDHWLLKRRDTTPVKEQPYVKESNADLRVFPGHKLPDDALPTDRFIASLKAAHRQQWEALAPRNRAGFKRFVVTTLPAWRRTLLVDWPVNQSVATTKDRVNGDSYIRSRLEIGQRSGTARLVATQFTPVKLKSGRSGKPVLVVLADSAARPGRYEADGQPLGLARKLVEHGYAVIAIEQFSTTPPQNQFGNFFSTYNRTYLQQCVRDLLAVCEQARTLDSGRKSRVVLCGRGRAGVWSLLAATGADAVVADAGALDVSDDETLLAPEWFCPGLRNLGTFEGGAMLAAPHPLLLHHTGGTFPTQGIASAYQAVAARGKLKIETGLLPDDALVDWVAGL